MEGIGGGGPVGIEDGTGGGARDRLMSRLIALTVLEESRESRSVEPAGLETGTGGGIPELDILYCGELPYCCGCPCCV